MSNIPTIQPTKFEDTRTGEVSFGVRVYDDYGQTYDNSWDSIPDDDLEVLQKCMIEGNEITQGILSFVQEEGKSIDIGPVLYDWEQIKHLWSESEECEHESP